MTAPSLTPAPIPPELPHSYVIVRRAQQCACGSLHTFSELYAKSHLPSRFGSNKVTHLRPILTPEYNLPITFLFSELKRIPFCHECAGLATLAHLPPPPTPEKRNVAPSWVGAPESPPSQPPERRPKVGAPTTRTRTLDDILDFLAKE